MKINKNNYEIFFIDYLDNKLSYREIKELETFLSQNPELAEELENLKNISLIPENINFDNKDFLKKITGKKLIINENNFDDICAAKIEKDLDDAENKEFEEYLLKHPEKKNEYILYQKTRLVADLSIKFENKILLKKSNHIVYRKWIYASVSVAASILIIFYFFFSKFNISENNKPKTIAKKYVEKPLVKPEENKIKSGESKQIVINAEPEIPNVHNKNKIIFRPAMKTIPINEYHKIDSTINYEEIPSDEFNITNINPNSIQGISDSSAKSSKIFVDLKKTDKKIVQKSTPKDDNYPIADLVKDELIKYVKYRKSGSDKNKFDLKDITKQAFKNVGKIFSHKIKFENNYNKDEHSEILALYNEKTAIFKIEKTK